MNPITPAPTARHFRMARFVGEAWITCVVATRDAQGEVVVAGDGRGRVYFLR